MKLEGTVFKYGDNVDTDVIIPARYLNSSDPKELAAHCMEDIDKEFTSKLRTGTSSLRRRTSAAVHPESTLRSRSRPQASRS